MKEKLKKIFQKHREAILYIIVGVATTIVCGVTRMSIPSEGSEFMERVSLIVSNFVAITFAYITNKLIVFRNKAESRNALVKQILSFYAVRVISVIIDWLITELCIMRYNGFFIELFGFDKINYDSGIFKIGIVHNFINSPYLMNKMFFWISAQVVILTTNYILSKFLIFKKKKTDE